MSQSVLKNYWPSLLLSVILIAGLIVCLKRIDYLAIEEVNAFVTILFGSATSCLLLTFLCFNQHKHLNRPWPNQGLVVGRDILSMHPRGPMSSFEAYEANHIQNVDAIATIRIEQPPTYEDALANSKPLFTFYDNKSKKDQNCDDGIMPHQQQQQDNIQSSSSSSQLRKISYIQLDVGQLMLSSSPPKYCELHLNNYNQFMQSEQRSSCKKP